MRLATSIGMPSFALRSLRLHGRLLIDQGELEEGLRILALVCQWTRRGPDFTGWILDPRAWEESTRGVDRDNIQRAEQWANNQDLSDVVETALGMSEVSFTPVHSG